MNPTIRLNGERGGSIVPYLCWVIVLAIGFYDLVYLREVMVSFLVVAGTDPKLLLLADKIGFFFFGVIGLLIILLTETYFRRGWHQRCLALRFWKVVAVQIAVVAVFWSALLGLPGLADDARPSLVRLAAISGVLIVTAALHQRQVSRSASQSDS